MKYEFRTWHAESAVVAGILFSTAVLSGSHWYEWVGAAAVWCGFSHASIAERLREREAARETPSVECHNKLGWYFMGREVLWTVYFLALGAWSAIVGCIIFAVYPLWRRYWRRIHPLPVMLTIRDPKLWEAIKSGKVTGFSVGGFARREPLGLPVFDRIDALVDPAAPDAPGLAASREFIDSEISSAHDRNSTAHSSQE